MKNKQKDLEKITKRENDFFKRKNYINKELLTFFYFSILSVSVPLNRFKFLSAVILLSYKYGEEVWIWIEWN